MTRITNTILSPSIPNPQYKIYLNGRLTLTLITPNRPSRCVSWNYNRSLGEKNVRCFVALLLASTCHRNIRRRMRAPILFQVNKGRLINYWPIYKSKFNSPHDLLYRTLIGQIQHGGFIKGFLFSLRTPIT